jgi:hypothetical protein
MFQLILIRHKANKNMYERASLQSQRVSLWVEISPLQSSHGVATLDCATVLLSYIFVGLMSTHVDWQHVAILWIKDTSVSL